MKRGSSFLPTRLAVSLAVVALIGVSCTSGRTVGGDAAAVEVTLTELKITIGGEAPAERPLKLEVNNAGSAVHNLVAEVDGKTLRTAMIDPGKTATLTLPALKAGAYKLWCEVPGHREAVMEADLAVGASHSAAQGLSPEEMDKAHEARIKAFPAKTEGLGGQVWEPKVVDGVKVFEITAKAVSWEVTPGKKVESFSYNGQVLGPEIRVRKGDRFRLILHIELPESTSVHFHGMEVPNEMDGVPFITQPPVKRGESFTYEFAIKDPPGTYMYHSHHNAAVQVGKGLLGALIIEPDNKS